MRQIWEAIKFKADAIEWSSYENNFTCAHILWNYNQIENIMPFPGTTGLLICHRKQHQSKNSNVCRTGSTCRPLISTNFLILPWSIYPQLHYIQKLSCHSKPLMSYGNISKALVLHLKYMSIAISFSNPLTHHKFITINYSKKVDSNKNTVFYNRDRNQTKFLSFE